MIEDLGVKLSELRKEEIAQLRRELVGWGITISDLVKLSPKRISAKQSCNVVIEYILSEEMIINYMSKKKELPLVAVNKRTNISKRFVKKFEKYIMAVVIMKKGNYSYLKDYLFLENDMDVDIELNKGIIVGKKYGYATLMSKDGKFLNVKDKLDYKVGYEFDINPLVLYLSKLFEVRLSLNSLFQ